MNVTFPPELLDGVEPGIYSDVDNEVYHKGPGLSSTGVKKILRSPRHLVDPLIHPERYDSSDKSPALVFGSAVHKYLLEPDDFWNEYAVSPKVNRQRKEGKAIYKAFAELNEGKTLIGTEDLEKLKWMSESAHLPEHSSFLNAITAKQIETSVYWNDRESGRLLKIRPDIMKRVTLNRVGTLVCVDLKTSIDASYVSFSKSIHNFGYDVSAAMYSEGLRLMYPGVEDVRFLFAVIEKTPPFACAVYSLDPMSIETGYRKYRYGVTLFNQCIESNCWESYPDNVSPISMPRWAISN